MLPLVSDTIPIMQLELTDHGLLQLPKELGGYQDIQNIDTWTGQVQPVRQQALPGVVVMVFELRMIVRRCDYSSPAK